MRFGFRYGGLYSRFQVTRAVSEISEIHPNAVRGGFPPVGKGLTEDSSGLRSDDDRSLSEAARRRKADGRR